MAFKIKASILIQVRKQMYMRKNGLKKIIYKNKGNKHTSTVPGIQKIPECLWE